MIPSIRHLQVARDHLHGSWQSGGASDVGGIDPLAGTLNADLCDIIANLKFASHLADYQRDQRTHSYILLSIEGLFLLLLSDRK